MKKRSLVKKIMTVTIMALLLLSQVNIPVFANALEENKSEESISEQAEVTVQPAESEKEDTGEQAEEQPEVVQEQAVEEEQQLPEIEGNRLSSQTSAPLIDNRAAEKFVSFDGIDLAGNNTFTYDVRDVHQSAKTLSISAQFDGSANVTNRQIVIRLHNGLGLNSAPGMVATSADKNNWTFNPNDNEAKGLAISNGTYTPDPDIYGYSPKSGTLVYEIAQGIERVEIPMTLSFDIGFGANPGSKSFEDILEVSALSDISGVTTTINDEKIESYTITGEIHPLIYKNGSNQMINAGDSATIPFYLVSEGTSYSNSVGDPVLYNEVTQTFKLNKKLGFQKIDSPNNSLSEDQLSYSVDSTSDPDNDIVTLTIKNFKAGTTPPRISLYFTTAADLPEGSYRVQPTNISMIPYDSTESYQKGTGHSINIEVAPAFENKLSTSANTGTISNTPDVAAATNYPLGVYHLKNPFGETVNDQKVRLKFDDPSIGVTTIQLVTGRGQGATNIKVTTNKNEYNIESLAQTDSKSTTGVTKLDISNYTSDPDEFIKEVVYESTGYLSGSGSNSGNAVTYVLWQINPGVFYGKLLSTPATGNYKSTITTVPVSDGDLDGPSANQSTITMNVSNRTDISFRNNKMISADERVAGEIFTMEAEINIGKEEFNGAYVKKGFDFYLREGEYLQIDKESIKATQGDTVYSVADGTIVPIETTDNEGHRVVKFVLNDAILGIKNATTTHPVLKLSYSIKVKNDAPTIAISAADLLAVIPSGGDNVTVFTNSAYFNNPNKFDVDGSGNTTKRVGTLNKSSSLQIRERKDFTVTTSVNLNGGPWTSYDYYTDQTIIDLNPKGKTNYRLSVTNNTSSVVHGYSALIPVPKAGEKTSLTPENPEDFDPYLHLQKEVFGWTTSLSEEIVTNGDLNYEILYATTYETDKDSANFKPWNEIKNKKDIRMIKISTTEEIPDQYKESIEFPLDLDDPDAEMNAGKMNIYSAYIYRSTQSLAGYAPSEPIAIRLQTGVVKGQVFNDANRNGLKDKDEKGRNGVTVFAYETGTSNVIDSTITKTMDGEDGRYEFLGLAKDQNVDVVFINPTTNDETRFSPTTNGGSTPTESADHSEAVTSNLVPSANNFDQINAGIIEPVTITLNPVGGTTANTKIKKYPGEEITEEPTATYLGTTFNGWYDAILGGNKVSFPYVVGTQDTTLFAQYTPNQYQVTYDVEGKTTADSVAFDTLLTEPKAPTKVGYDFTGWYDAATGGTKWDFAKNKMPANDVTLYAQFAIAKYDVVFNNEGTETKVSTTYDTLIAEPTAPTKTGYTFDGWYDAATGGNKWDFATDKMPAKELTLYARYTVNTYQATFNDQGTETKVSAAFDTLLTEPTKPTKTGYDFTGWYDAATGGTKWDFAKNKMPANDVTLYAQFTAVKYDVIFNDDGTETKVSATYDSLLTEPTAPTKEGHTFVGWYDAKTAGNQWNFATDKMPAKGITLYARYTVNTYQVTFNDQGTETKVSATYDTLLTEPATPTKTGYTFIGWYDTETGAGNKWDFATNKVPGKDLTLYARFTEGDYTLTFNNDGETSNQTVAYDALVTEPAAPTKVGYTFTGWYDAATGGNQWNFATDKMPAYDFTLYAQYTVNDYQVTFNNEGEENTLSAPFDSLLTEPTAPTKAGYTFKGWKEQLSGNTWNFSADKVPARDMTLVAQFKADNQTITFDVTDGDAASKPADLIAPTDSAVDIDAVKKPTKAGYRFIGWYNGTTQVSGTILMPAGGLDLEAKWTAVDQVIAFDTAGGTGVASITAKTDETVDIDAQVTTKAGYKFEGWYDGKTQVSGVITVPVGGLNLTAKWTAEDQTITFDVNGGNEAEKPADITLPTDETVDLNAVTEPTRVGYKFAGWYDGTTKYSGKINMPAGGLNLKAEWIDLIASGIWTLEAQDFEIKLSDLKELQANGTLEAKVLELSNAKAWDNDNQVALDPIQVNVTSLYSTEQAGQYQVELSVDPELVASSKRNATKDVKADEAASELLTKSVTVNVIDDTQPEQDVDTDSSSQENKTETTPSTTNESKADEEDENQLPSTGEKVSYGFLAGLMLLLVGYFIKDNKKRATKN